MIAITGSNGGCGKTTTTLGLARALAGPDDPVLAVDADRQLPDLHVAAGVDRTPTLAGVADADDPARLAQPASSLPGVAVLPGPTPEESLDVERALSALDTLDATTLVDCPAGIGPDLTDPLTAAERVVVVAGGEAGRPTDVRTTVDIARRLDVTVAGVLVTKAETIPGAIEAAVDVPVLGAVPPSASPLSDEATRAAYERAGAALTGASGDQATNSTTAPDRLPTGVDTLDRVLGGGFPPGSVVALVADPGSHAERLLHRVPATRGTLYVSTDRPEPLVAAAVAADPGSAARPTVRAVGADPIAETAALLPDLPGGATLVVDAADALEAGNREAYGGFLEALGERMAETGGVAILHCPDRGTATPNRALSQRAADVVVTVGAVASGKQLDQRAVVTKCRPDPTATGVASLCPDGLAVESTSR